MKRHSGPTRPTKRKPAQSTRRKVAIRPPSIPVGVPIEDLILAAAIRLESQVFEEAMSKIKGQNSTETKHMRKLLRVALSTGEMGDILETASLLGIAIKQFIIPFTR